MKYLNQLILLLFLSLLLIACGGASTSLPTDAPPPDAAEPAAPADTGPTPTDYIYPTERSPITATFRPEDAAAATATVEAFVEAVTAGVPVTSCTEVNPHPVGQSIAETYPDAVTYDEVMTHFCSGYIFEDILTGIETGLETGEPLADVLALYDELESWEATWAAFGLLDE